MKLPVPWPAAILLLACAVLGGRLAWTVSTSPLGCRPVLAQWRDAARGAIGLRTRLPGEWEPAAQGRFWLREVANVGAVDHDPQVAMGAAWLLSGPQLTFVQQHFRERKDVPFPPDFFPDLPLAARLELDWDTVARLIEDSKALCRDECLARIDAAVRLDAANVEVWRAAALLSFQSEFGHLHWKPRRDDWLALLNEGTAHDPDNALYDYLAAHQLWSTSATYEWQEDGWTIHVSDQASFDEAEARFAAGQAKRFLRFGETAYAAPLAFLQESSIPRADHVSLVGGRQSNGRANDLLLVVLRWQHVFHDVHKREQDHEAAIGVLHGVQHLSAQVSDAGNDTGIATIRLRLRRWSLANLAEWQQSHPELFRAGEAEQIATEAQQVELERGILNEAGRRLAASATGLANAGDGSKHGALPALLLVGPSQSLVIVTLGLALLVWLITRPFRAGKDEHVRAPSWYGALAVWLLAFGVGLAISSAMSVGAHSPLYFLAEPEVRKAMNLEGPGVVTLIRWQAFHAPVLTPLAAVTLLLIWRLFRNARTPREDAAAVPTLVQRLRVRSAGTHVARTSLVASLLFLLVYLAVAPPMVHQMNDRWQRQYPRLADPSHDWQELNAEMDLIRSDESLMAKLREEAAA